MSRKRKSHLHLLFLPGIRFPDQGPPRKNGVGEWNSSAVTWKNSKVQGFWAWLWQIWPEFYDSPFQTQPLLGAVVLGDGESEEARSRQQDVQKKRLWGVCEEIGWQLVERAVPRSSPALSFLSTVHHLQLLHCLSNLHSVIFRNLIFNPHLSEPGRRDTTQS